MNKFQPCLWLVGATSIKRPLFTIAIFGENFREVRLPENIAKLPIDLETKLVGMIARKHFRQSNGEIPIFGGQIRYYVYKRSETESWALRIDGRVIGRNLTPIPPRKYTVRLKAKPHTDISLLFKGRKTR